MSQAHQLYNKYFNTYKEEFNSEDLIEEDKILFDPNQYKILGKKKQKLELTEEKIKGEFQKPLWFEINKPVFKELPDDIYSNQDNKDFKITINKRTYDLKNAKKNWTQVTRTKISKNETENLYIDALTREKSNSIKKLNIFDKLNKYAQCLLALICTAKRCLRKQYLKEKLQRD